MLCVDLLTSFQIHNVDSAQQNRFDLCTTSDSVDA